jgi:uncharacterized membrane protein
MQVPSAAIDKHRLAGLQDGVYSIAMTLLVLELKLPALPEHATDAVLWGAILVIWPKLLTWLLSSWVLAVFWIRDVQTLAAFNVVNSFLLRIGLSCLALISLLPFSTALIGEYGSLGAGAAVYSGHLFLLAGAQVLRTVYLRMHPDVVTWPIPGASEELATQSWATLVCTGAAFGLAFVAPGYNMLALLPLVFARIASKLGSKRHTTNAA